MNLAEKISSAELEIIQILWREGIPISSVGSIISLILFLLKPLIKDQLSKQ